MRGQSRQPLNAPLAWPASARQLWARQWGSATCLHREQSQGHASFSREGWGAFPVSSAFASQRELGGPRQVSGGGGGLPLLPSLAQDSGALDEDLFACEFAGQGGICLGIRRAAFGRP